MPFVPRTIEDILTDMIAFVRTNSKITDFNVGSVARTILEAAALEDREQYMRMLQILKAFSYRTASSEDLDRRASDFNIVRLPAAKAYGNVIVMNDDLKRTYFSDDIAIGTSTAQVEDASVFSVPPISVRLGEGTSDQEDLTITSVDLTGNLVSFSSATAYDHSGLSSLSSSINEWEISAARISEVNGDPDQIVNAGLMVNAPSIGDLAAVEFVTTIASILYNGNFQTDLVPILAMSSGPVGIVGPKRVSGFTASPPFSGALVVNPAATGGGAYTETDKKFVDRIENTLGSLGGATVNSIIATALSTNLPITGQKAAKVSVREEFVIDVNKPGDGRVSVFIDDGSGNFVPDVTTFPYGTIENPGILATDLTIPLTVQEGTLPATGYIVLDPGATSGFSEVVEYESYTYSGFVVHVSLTSAVVNNYAAGLDWAFVSLVDSNVFTNKFYNLGNIAIIESDFTLYNDTGTTVDVLEMFNPDVGNTTTADYLLASGVGQIEVLSNLTTGSKLYAWYSFYGGLINEVQRKLDGDVRSPSSYPGTKAAGINLVVKPPNYVYVDINISLVVGEGADPNVERERADRIVRNYVNELNCGESLILTEIIHRVKGDNVLDMMILQPANNINVDEDEVIVIQNLSIS